MLELTQSFFCATFRRSRIERERHWFVNKTANERDFREEFAQISKIRVLDDRVLKIRVLDDTDRVVTVLIQPPLGVSLKKYDQTHKGLWECLSHRSALSREATHSFQNIAPAQGKVDVSRDGHGRAGTGDATWLEGSISGDADAVL